MNKRIKYMDIAKGILITMTVFGHIFMKHSFVRNFIYTFHMPAFFLISGILLSYSKKLISFSEMLKKKIYSLIIPFFFFEFIGVLLDFFRGGPYLNIKGYMYVTLTLVFNNRPNWFLIALFIATIVLNAIQHMTSDNKKRAILLLPVIIILIFLHPKNPRFGEAGVGLFFFAFGYFFPSLFINDNKLLIPIAGIITLLITILNGSVDITEWRFNNIPLFIIGAISGSIFILGVSRLLEKEDRLFDYYGNNSLTILGTHNFFISIFRYHAKVNEFNVASGIAILIFVMLIEIFIITVFNRYIPFLVGKPAYSNNSLLNLIYPNKKQRC